MIRVIFDTETTGLLKASATPIQKQPKIIELYAILVEGPKLKQVDEFHALYQPGERLDPIITKITSIDDKMLKGKPTWAKLHKECSEFFSHAHQVAAHNLTFDYDMVNLETKRLKITLNSTKDFQWPKMKLCSVEATEHLLGRRLKLIELHNHLFGEDFDGSHRAKADVQALHRCLAELVKRNEIL